MSEPTSTGPSGGHAGTGADHLPALTEPGTIAVPSGGTVPVFGGPGEADLERPKLPAPIRRDARVGKPARRPDWLLAQLPVGMLQSPFFVRFVAIFQELGSTLLDDADLIDHVADATVTPVPMISQLASWIGVDTIDPSLPEELQRLILRSSSRALAFRGTRQGLTEYLRTLSGGPAEVTDGGGIWPEGESPDDPAWVRMTVASSGHLSEDEFVAMVRDEIPAHVRAELWIGDRRVLDTAAAAAGGSGGWR